MDGFQDRKIHPREALLFFKMRSIFENLSVSLNNFNLILQALEEGKGYFYLTSPSFPERLSKYLENVVEVLNLEKASLYLFLDDLNNKKIDEVSYNNFLDELKPDFYSVNTRLKYQIKRLNAVKFALIKRHHFTNTGITIQK